jgi:hypothetical protein
MRKKETGIKTTKTKSEAECLGAEYCKKHESLKEALQTWGYIVHTTAVTLFKSIWRLHGVGFFFPNRTNLV